jgi:hypothetical protein
MQLMFSAGLVLATCWHQQCTALLSCDTCIVCAEAYAFLFLAEDCSRLTDVARTAAVCAVLCSQVPLSLATRAKWQHKVLRSTDYHSDDHSDDLS